MSRYIEKIKINCNLGWREYNIIFVGHMYTRTQCLGMYGFVDGNNTFQIYH
jgi:hypothetical protein